MIAMGDMDLFPVPKLMSEVYRYRARRNRENKNTTRRAFAKNALDLPFISGDILFGINTLILRKEIFYEKICETAA